MTPKKSLLCFQEHIKTSYESGKSPNVLGISKNDTEKKNKIFEKKSKFSNFSTFLGQKSIFENLRIFNGKFNYQFLIYFHDSRCKNNLLDVKNPKIIIVETRARTRARSSLVKIRKITKNRDFDPFLGHIFEISARAKKFQK